MKLKKIFLALVLSVAILFPSLATGSGYFGINRLPGNLLVNDDSWIGLGAAKCRLGFNDTTADELQILDCIVQIGTASGAGQVNITPLSAIIGLKINQSFGGEGIHSDSESGTHYAIKATGKYGMAIQQDLSGGNALIVSRNIDEAGSRALVEFSNPYANNTQPTLFTDHDGTGGVLGYGHHVDSENLVAPAGFFESPYIVTVAVGDPDSGLGSFAADQPNIVSGGVEAQRLTEASRTIESNASVCQDNSGIELKTVADHGLGVDDVVQVAAGTGSLCTGLSASTNYYVLAVGTTTTATLSASRGGSIVAYTDTGTAFTSYEMEITVNVYGDEEIQGKLTVNGALNFVPVTFAFTTEVDITDPITSTVVLLDGDNDGENDAIDLQDGTVAGQQLQLVAVADIDVNDTVTINMADTTCTNCVAIVFDEIGENASLGWTGSTWYIISIVDAL